MSEQPPPSFGGPPHYAQQWPPVYPAMMPPTFAIPQDFSATNSHQNHSAPFDYNMANVDANSRIPASSDGLNPAAFFPPQFPFFNQFDPSQFPPNFSPMHFAPMGHQPIPMPTASASATPLPQQTPQHSNPTFVKPTKSKGILIRAPPSREEGEVSEPVHEKPLKASRKPSRQYSDMEEGETMSSSGRSSRSSGSPYNPPLSVSADPTIVQPAMDAQTRPTKSAAQLRIQAQGALLSLAPHKIRYNELVAEGINPAILKRLYEEVGIKVTSDSDATASNREGLSNAIKPANLSPSIKQPQSAAKSKVPAPRTAISAAAGLKSAKPMERKELIAQMLAEKAAKVASKEASPIESTPFAPVVSEEARPPKEKSKAQTELARQRIEELRQKALLKTKQKLQESLLPVVQESTAPAIHHPLPVRPPVPASHTPVTPVGLPVLPGLSLPSAHSQEAVPDPTPISRTIHRKRPLASDFDEPLANSKKHFNPTVDRFKPADRLIIAISDDESLYGDDEDDQMELDSGSEQEATPLINAANANLSTSGHLSSTRASTSTPQAPHSSNDQGQIQSKDLQIQEMRRRIAELELRRKSKLAASQTQSPRTVDDSSASTSTQSSSADVGISDAGASMASHDESISKPHSSAPEALAAQTLGIPSPEAAPALSDSGSEGSAMEESDDSSSDSSDSSDEEDEASSSPVPADVPAPAEPMDVESSRQSPSEDLPDVNGSSPVDLSQRESSVESEAYEPPEPESDAQSEGSSYSPPPFSPAPDPVDIIAASMPSLDAAEPTAAEPTAELTTAPQASDPPSQTDLQVGVLGTEDSSADSVRKHSAHKFTPYTSPLRSFKAYRYHPNFSEDIPSGYRSLTYSHDIDLMKTLCPYEISGGVCNDRSCDFQHLRDLSLSELLTLTDDKILIQMGSAREGQTEEEKEAYLAGLKEIINDLRRDKVKDFNTVASEIAAYRRRFLQDPSRVLSL
ncbi:unnamed protein product [Penicillium bialowiezense]